MTAIRARRIRSTWLALGLTVAALVLAAGLTIVGARTLADSRAGRLAAGQRDVLPSQRLPYTPTALVGTIDDDGRLTSVVVMVVEPDGTGGSIVEFAASADAESGTTRELAPLDAVLAVDGPDAFRGAAETLASVSFDVVELVDEERFAELVSPLGDLPATLPTAVHDDSSGDRWEAGEVVLSAAAAGRVLTATSPDVVDYLFEPARAAVWGAVADRVGAGIGSAEAVASDSDLPQPGSLDELLDRLYAGAVRFRAMPVRTIDASRIEDQLPDEYADAFESTEGPAVAIHDRAEALLVMGSIAPGRMGAPLEAPTFRVVSGFAEGELEPLGDGPADVLKAAIDRLVFAKVNVVSVAELPDADAPEHSVLVVADPDTIDAVREEYASTFGEGVEVRAADVLIEGVDIELTLGRDFLDALVGGAAVNVESSAPDASTGGPNG